MLKEHNIYSYRANQVESEEKDEIITALPKTVPSELAQTLPPESVTPSDDKGSSRHLDQLSRSLPSIAYQ